MAIEVVCDCGKRFQVKDEYAGKRGKCLGCGKVVVVPSLVSSEIDAPFIDPIWKITPSTPVTDQPIPVSENAHKSRERLFWSGFAGFLIVLVLVSVLFFQQHQRSSANREVGRRVIAARTAADQQHWDEAIEELRSAIETKYSTDHDEARQLLAEVEVSMARAKAEKVLRSARQSLANKDIDTTLRLLDRYSSLPNAEKLNEAKELSAAIRHASSDREAALALRESTDKELESFKLTGEFAALKNMSNESIRIIYGDTLRRNLDLEQKRRKYEAEQFAESERLTQKKELDRQEMQDQLDAAAKAEALRSALAAKEELLQLQSARDEYNTRARSAVMDQTKYDKWKQVDNDDNTVLSKKIAANILYLRLAELRVSGQLNKINIINCTLPETSAGH